MKKPFALWIALSFAGFAAAQEIRTDTVPALPPYVYCEIIASNLPWHGSRGVLFDFGQETTALRYNYLTDADGNRLLFNSGVEALNYMVGRGWEFVQAYASGEDNGKRHYLLRADPAKLTAVQCRALPAPPEPDKPKTRKKR